jgi:putative ABC transport system permease protein
MRFEHWFYTLPLRLRSLFRRREVEQELDEELRFHLERKTEQYIAEGMTLEEARYAARRAMGGIEQKKEEVRDMRRVNFLETLIQDSRYGLRMLRKNPGFTAVAVLTLGLGIGANTAVFSVANAIFLHPLPFVKDATRLAIIRETLPDGSCCKIPTANFLDMRQDNNSFAAMAAYKWKAGTIVIDSIPESVTGVQVSEDFFKLLGVRPAWGRTFLPEELQADHSVVILSYGCWQNRFGVDTQVLGKTIQLDGKDHTVVGVMGKEFDFPAATDLWMPLVFTGADASSRSPGRLNGVALLAPSVSLKQAQTAMDVVAQRLEKEYPKTEQRSQIRLLSLRDNINGNLTPVFSMTLLGAAGFFLLIACSNVANLQLARGDARKQEMAIRAALGAGRTRITLQLLTESFFLALLGAGLGLLVAKAGVALILAGMPPETGRQISGWENISLNGRVLLFAGGVTLLVAVLSGLTPALHSARLGLSETLKSCGMKASPGRESQRMRSAFVGAQISLAMILLIGAGLMVKGFGAMLAASNTFEPGSLLTMHVSLLDGRYRDSRSRIAFYDQALERLAALPGVASACVFTGPPFSNNEVIWWEFRIEGQPDNARRNSAVVQNVSPDYFRALKIGLLDGREFTPQDTETSMPVAIVGEKLARRYWPGGTPIGQHLKLGLRDSKEPWLTIIGVAADVEYDWTDNTSEPAIYLPYRQTPATYSYLAIRTAVDPRSLIGAVPHEMATVDAQLPVTDMKTLGRAMTASMSGLFEIGGLMTALGFIGLVVSVIGVYGVSAYSVGKRTQEIGIRMAFGARPRDVLRLILGQGILLATIGVGIGVIGALFLTRLVSGFFYGVSPTDPFTFAVIAAVLGGASVVACWVPARRAMRVDPMVALRYE